VELSDDAVWGRDRAVLHEEINRLPRTSRMAIILCDLEGYSPRAAAAQLGWPVRGIESRLAQARRHLRERLARAGSPLSEACGIAELLRVGESLVSRRLIESTVRIATRSRGRGALETPRRERPANQTRAAGVQSRDVEWGSEEML